MVHQIFIVLVKLIVILFYKHPIDALLDSTATLLFSFVAMLVSITALQLLLSLYGLACRFVGLFIDLNCCFVGLTCSFADFFPAALASPASLLIFFAAFLISFATLLFFVVVFATLLISLDILPGFFLPPYWSHLSLCLSFCHLTGLVHPYDGPNCRIACLTCLFVEFSYILAGLFCSFVNSCFCHHGFSFDKFFLFLSLR